jgi:hypothetical protein
VILGDKFEMLPYEFAEGSITLSRA